MTDVDRLFELKGHILESWRQLPTEHQATIFLVLMNELRRDDYYDAWLRQALPLMLQQTEDDE